MENHVLITDSEAPPCIGRAGSLELRAAAGEQRRIAETFLRGVPCFEKVVGVGSE